MISSELSFSLSLSHFPPFLGRRAHELYGVPLIFLKGIGSDGYTSGWGVRESQDASKRDFNLKRRVRPVSSRNR